MDRLACVPRDAEGQRGVKFSCLLSRGVERKKRRRKRVRTISRWQRGRYSTIFTHSCPRVACRPAFVGHEGSLMRPTRRRRRGAVGVHHARTTERRAVWTIPSDVLDATTMETSAVPIRPSAVLAGHVARVWDCVRERRAARVCERCEDCSPASAVANAAQGAETLAEGVATRSVRTSGASRSSRARHLASVNADSANARLCSSSRRQSLKRQGVEHERLDASPGAADSTTLHESVTGVPTQRCSWTMMRTTARHRWPKTKTSSETKSKKRKKKSKRRKSFFGPNDEYVASCASRDTV